MIKILCGMAMKDAEGPPGFVTPATQAECVAEIERLRAALEQAIDDMGDAGKCVCQQTKEMMQAALAPAVEQTAQRIASGLPPTPQHLWTDEEAARVAEQQRKDKR